MGLYIISAVYVLAGLNHFRSPQFYLPMMPPYIPWHKAMISLSGVCEIGLGVLILWPVTRSAAAWGIIAMLTVFMTVHIYMFQERHNKFKQISPLVIIGRLPLQAVLIYWAYLYT